MKAVFLLRNNDSKYHRESSDVVIVSEKMRPVKPSFKFILR